MPFINWNQQFLKLANDESDMYHAFILYLVNYKKVIFKHHVL